MNCIIVTKWMAVIKKSKILKWLPWLGAIPIFLIPVLGAYNGEAAKGIGVFLSIAGLYVGAAIGVYLGRVLNERFLKQPQEFGERLGHGLAAFGFLFVPALIASWSNTYLETVIGVGSMGIHFLWACVGGTIFFFVRSPKTDE